MSRAIESASDYITQGSVALPLTGSLHFLIYPGWAQTDGVSHVFYDVFQTAGSQFFRMQKFSDNNLYCGWVNTSDYRIATGTYTLNANAWNSFLITWVNGGDSKLYLNGSQVGSTVGSTSPFTSSVTRYIGILDPGTGASQSAVARFAHYAVWSAALDDAEAAALAKFIVPGLIRPSALEDWLPLVSRASPEPNVMGGTAGTLTGTSIVDNPLMYWSAAPVQIGVPAAAAGFDAATFPYPRQLPPPRPRVGVVAY